MISSIKRYPARALIDVAFVWGFSTLAPVLLLWLTGALLGGAEFSTISGFPHAFSLYFVPSEVFIYIAAILAPTAYFMVFNWRASRHVQFYNIMFFLVWITLGLTAVVYALGKAEVIGNPVLVNQISLVTYIFALTIWLLARSYEHYLNDAIQETHEDRPPSLVAKMKAKGHG